MPRLEEADMKRRLSVTAIFLSVSSLLCACAAGGSVHPAATPVTSPAGVTRHTRPSAAVAYIQGFYRSYATARELGQRAAAAVVLAHVAAWYYPVLEAPYEAGADPVACGLRGPVADWSFRQAGVLGGQAVIVIGSRPPGAPQELWIIATTAPGTGKITGITCSAGENVTSAGATDAVTSLYRGYITARRKGVAPQEVIARLMTGGPESADPYLRQLRYAITRKQLGYDPVTCTAAGVPDVSAGGARVVAGHSAGVVVVTAHRTKFLATVVLGAKGWAVGDIACPQRP